MKIVVDNREKRPFTFEGFSDIEIVEGRLVTGDYSIFGAESCVAVERKSMNDLALSLGCNRERFKRELERSRALQSFAVVVEGSYDDVVQGRYASQLSPKSGISSLMAFASRLGISFLFAGSRANAEHATATFLWQYQNGEIKRLRSLEKAMGLPTSQTTTQCKGK